MDLIKNGHINLRNMENNDCVQINRIQKITY